MNTVKNLDSCIVELKRYQKIILAIIGTILFICPPMILFPFVYEYFIVPEMRITKRKLYKLLKNEKFPKPYHYGLCSCYTWQGENWHLNYYYDSGLMGFHHKDPHKDCMSLTDLDIPGRRLNKKIQQLLLDSVN